MLRLSNASLKRCPLLKFITHTYQPSSIREACPPAGLQSALHGIGHGIHRHGNARVEKNTFHQLFWGLSCLWGRSRDDKRQSGTSSASSRRPSVFSQCAPVPPPPRELFDSGLHVCVSQCCSKPNSF